MMLLQFRLAWLKPGVVASKGFKFPASSQLYHEYTGRIGKFVPCHTGGLKDSKKAPGIERWICDRKGKEISSEVLADHLNSLFNQGRRNLEIIIGGPDGFSSHELHALKPDFRWSFGPLTFPHELAAVLAAEQVYRAFTIIRKMPYHLGHR